MDLPSKRRNSAYVELSISSLDTKDTTIAILIPNSFLIKSVLPEIPETPTEKKKSKIFFKIYKCIYFNWRRMTLQYCIGFAIPQHESATGISVLLSDFWKESFFFFSLNENISLPQFFF